MDATLPGPLRAALAARLEGVSRNDLAKISARLSEAYRSGRPSAAAVTSEGDVTAYLVTRMPATYAAVHAALRQLALAAPDFAPQSLVDVGAGPGTASWAAAAIWPTIVDVTLVERAPRFLAAATALAAAAGAPAAIAGARHVRADALRDDLAAADMALAAYALAEIAEAEQAALVARLWNAAQGAVLLVEPGTPEGYRRIVRARAGLIAAGATIAAPCPHDLACPIVPPDWCHFAARLPRSRDHRLAKGAETPFEDEKFSWVAATRPHVGLVRRPRVLAPPRRSKAEIGLKLCTRDGTIAGATIGRRSGKAYPEARRLAWGDAVGD